MLQRFVFLFSIVISLAGVGCDESDVKRPFCSVNRVGPYAQNMPYVGVHGGPANNDYIPCVSSDRYAVAWHQLKGLAIGQPNTFSPDGRTLYVTTSQPTEDACNVWALDTVTGDDLWCRRVPGDAIWSAIEVDSDGVLYLTTELGILSLTAAGEQRWATEIARVEADGRSDGAVGLHFTPNGEIATVTNLGVVTLVSRATGAVITRLDIPAEFGWELPPPAEQGTLTRLLPDEVLMDFNGLQFGGPSRLLNTFSGEGNFSDNTAAVAPDGRIYVIGGDSFDGALFQINVDRSGPEPKLVSGWHLKTKGSSATSPAVSPDGQQVKVSDGNGTLGLLDPLNAGAKTYLANIAECDANEDSNPDATICAPSVTIPLLSGPAMGTTPMLNEGVHYHYEIQVSDLLNTDTPDLRAFSGGSLLWEIRLPDDLQWTSVITVTENHLIGTATRFTASGESILGIVELPETADSDLLVLNRQTGEIVFRHPISDDSTSTVSVGPDGSLYVTMLCLMHTFALETRPVGGLIRFIPD